MQLKSIKLVGFKSFADATTIPITHDMTAIVGPNGCGKSNVIDAVRWVIGELSAKQLRGKSMTDVIFNGAGGRHPAGKAAVELCFDNSDGAVGGEYANYAELVIRREVTREAVSSYFINGNACRRKDIIDVFLGTGLGARSYAIIEQGMVSRLIEAKPEELRVFLEEAAGISKYRERRRETENRIKHTKENLDRVNDLCDEIGKQLAHLRRQATAAEKYKEFKELEAKLTLELNAMKWRQYDELLQASAQQVQELSNKQESLKAELSELETNMESARLESIEAGDAHNAVQKQYYGLGAEIARLEQRIKHIEEQTQQWELELDQTTAIYQELVQNTDESRDQISELRSEIETLAPQQENAQTQKQQAQEALSVAEERMQSWQEQWDQFQQQLSQSAKMAEVSKTKVGHHKEQIEKLSVRKQKVKEQFESLSLEQMQREISPKALELEQAQASKAQLQEQIEQQKQVFAGQKLAHEGLLDDLQVKRDDMVALEAKQSSLQALQASALSRSEASQEWLEHQGLQNRDRLAETMQINSGWEQAVEQVLQGYLDAVCVEDFGQYLNSLAELKDGQILLLDQNRSNAEGEAHFPLPPLSQKISTQWPVGSLLYGVYAAQDLQQAQGYRNQLKAHQSIVTQDGYWLGANWIRSYQAQDMEQSILLREKELAQVTQAIDEQHEHVSSAQMRVDESKVILESSEAKLEDLQTELEIANGHWTEAKSELSAAQALLSESQIRREELQSELNQIEQQLEQSQQNLLQAETSWQSSESSQTDQEAQRESLLAQRTELRQTLDQAREDAQQKRQFADQVGIRLAANENQLALLEQTLNRDARQLEQITDKRESLEGQLAQNDNPTDGLQAELQALLTKRSEVEEELHAAEHKVQGLQQRIQELDDSRNQNNHQQLETQAQMQEVQVERQTSVVNRNNVQELIVEQMPVEQAVQQIPENANAADWASELDKLDTRIRRLGPINLAAIEESTSLAERKEYLDKQQADLHEALGILEGAIRKIDQETRHTFKDTFDKVNENFGKLFPAVFGGGSAALELMDEDILVAGVSVRAQPPGKRNSTIQMLSGGEKALTAIALVFSLFRLNPAPFCILDEVDAPLDDLNVERYCGLIREMAGEVQFLVISHNKVTIEKADELLGVTMQEAGVSRVVTVDMDQAVAMAD